MTLARYGCSVRELKSRLASEQREGHLSHQALERALVEERLLDEELARVAPRTPRADVPRK